jgi:hypothetical protein
MSASNAISSSLALDSQLLSGTGSVGFTTTGSFTATSSSLSSRTTQIESVYATTGSNSFRATQSITGSLTVTGQIIAQTLNVQQVTSSIVFSSGSNTFGCDLNSRQTFTGSVLMTGSLIVNTTGTELQVTNNGVILGNLLTDNHSVTGSLRVTGSATFASSVNIGTAGIEKLNIFGSGSQFINVKNTTTNADMFVGMSSALSAAFIGTGGTDPIVFSTAGTERMRINSCGNVGINVSCPANLLHLAGASATPSLRLGSISTGFHWDIGRENATTGDFLFNNANGGCTFERLRITTSGNVGIGTCSPATKLTVYPVIGGICGTNDAIRLQVQSYENAARNTIVWGQDSSNLVLARFGLEWNLSAAQMNFVWRDMYNSTAGSTELMRLTGGGNLGIGTSSPTNALHISGSGANTQTLTLEGSPSSANAYVVYKSASKMYFSGLSSDQSNNFIIYDGTANTTRIAITSGGNVGIGTTTPGSKLEVSGETVIKFTDSIFTVQGNTGFGLARIYGNSNAVELQLGAHQVSGIASLGTYTSSPLAIKTSNSERMRINSCGGVRIGSTTAFNDDIRLNVYGTGVWDGANIGLQNGGAGGKDWIIFSTNNLFAQGAGNLLFYNNSGPTANALIIYANGNYDFGGSDVSDARLKQCIQNLNYGVNEIMQLSPKSYNLKSQDTLQQENQTVLRKRYGFIAQEVQPILPDTITGQETETDYLGLDYNGVLAVAVKAIQEQQCTINLLKTCIGIA